jgi:hypothetical protein
MIGNVTSISGCMGRRAMMMKKCLSRAARLACLAALADGGVRRAGDAGLGCGIADVAGVSSDQVAGRPVIKTDEDVPPYTVNRM